MRPNLLLLLLIAAPARAQDGRAVVFRDATVIDATESRPRAGQTVVVEGGRITYVGPAAGRRPPPGAVVVDAAGKFLIPGLWDMHVHLTKGGSTSLPLFVANGVTSVRDMGSDFAEVGAGRGAVAAGRRVGPRIRTAGPILESAANVQRMLNERTVEPVARIRAPVRDSAHARAVVDSIARLGVDFLKIRTYASRSALAGIVAAAREAGLALVGHPPGVGVEDTLRRAWSSFEHGFAPLLNEAAPEWRQGVFRDLAARRTAVVPTLVTMRESLLVPVARAGEVTRDTLARTEARRAYVGGYLIEDWKEQVAEREGIDLDELRRLFASGVRNLREMRAAGVRLMPGTDVGVLLIFPGFTLHDELGWFVRDLGFTPWEALAAATREPAAFFGVEGQVGTIEAGKLADLVLLDADPLADIGNTRRIAGVLSHGVWRDRRALDALLAEVRAEHRGAR
jgi:hypothetical protein